MIYLGYVRSDEAYVAESPDESARFRAEAADWYRKADQAKEAHARATGQPCRPVRRQQLLSYAFRGKHRSHHFRLIPAFDCACTTATTPAARFQAINGHPSTMLKSMSAESQVAVASYFE
jgi:hypothetical protein